MWLAHVEGSWRALLPETFVLPAWIAGPIVEDLARELGLEPGGARERPSEIG